MDGVFLNNLITQGLGSEQILFLPGPLPPDVQSEMVLAVMALANFQPLGKK